MSLRAVRVYTHDSAAFTEGLALRDGILYESIGGYGRSSLHKVAIATGKVLRRVDVPGPYFAEGLTILGQYIYMLTWKAQIGFIFDIRTLKRIGTFQYRGEGWGLTTDGRSLIISNGTDAIQYLDPATLVVTRTLRVMDGSHSVSMLNELEWVEGELWANVWQEDDIVRIDPETGQVIGWLSLGALLPPVRSENPEAVANGIAFDRMRGDLVVTGKLWPVLYEVRRPTR